MPTENRNLKTENRHFRIITFGCKVNQVDSAGMAQALADLGWREAGHLAPDLALVNTCTVTARADQQARQAVRRLARDYPGLPIWVTGCYAQRAPQEMGSLPGVRAVLGNREKALIGKLGADCSGSPPEIRVAPFSPAEPFHSWRLRSFPGHTRAWLKIQDGCSHGCNYCIVPRVRGPRRSLPPEQVAASFRELAARGYREVVLTGVDLGQYGRDLAPASDLAALVRDLRGEALPFRVRFSSLEPQEVDAALLNELAAWQEFCPHFHLPLQSGSDAVLAAMARPYQARDFLTLAREIQQRFSGAGLGLDVLVGFPGESAADFEATRDLVAALPVTYLHVFPFSARPGTPAAQMTPLPAREIRERARVMRDLGRKKKMEFLQAQIGLVREVLVEGPAPQAGWLQGLSDHYLRVVFPGPKEWRNRRLRVRFLHLMGEALAGEVVEETG
jgi:threonylcarbamoyladenosine tRNA methylthiotransferase MtaB